MARRFVSERSRIYVQTKDSIEEVTKIFVKSAVALLIGILLLLWGFERMSEDTGGHGRLFVMAISLFVYSGWKICKETSFPPGPPEGRKSTRGDDE